MYTDPKVVTQELDRRRRDKGLQAAVLEFVGGELPECWPEGQRIATINRYLATSRMEDVMFAHAAQSLGVKPFWPTYEREAFRGVNPEKVSCLKPRVQTKGSQFSKQSLVAKGRMAELEGTPLGDIMVGSRSLIQVHGDARQVVLGDVAENVFDISAWNIAQARRFGATGTPGERLAPHYYNGVMALYIRDGILFEDFDGGPNAGSGLGGFVDDVVMPAIKRVSALFGLDPLIVRLPYVPGFLDYPAPAAPIFDSYRER